MLLSTTIDFWLETGMAIAGILGGLTIGFSYFRKKYETIKEKREERTINPLLTKYSKHGTIHEMLTSLRLHLNADRVQIAQFHNGGKFLEGTPIKKFSVTHESCGPGISMESQNFQNVIITLFWSIIELLKENDSKIRLTRALSVDSPIKIYNQSKNIEAFCLLPIKKSELFVGFIKAEWNSLHEVPDDYKECSTLMDRYRSFIELELIKDS